MTRLSNPARHWTDNFVGLPYVDGGRDRRGCDCWGLVRLVFAERAGIELPGYGDTSAADLSAVAREVADGAEKDPWRPVFRHDVRAFDVVVMAGRFRSGGSHRRAAVHVGVMADTMRVLHVEKRTAAVLMPLTHQFIRHRLLGIYRHKDL